MILSKLKVRARARRAAGALLNGVVRPLSGLARRSSRAWLFGHQGDAFAGNAKYLFLWITQNRPDIRVAWISDRPQTRAQLQAHGFEAHRRWSPGGVAAALRSGVFVFCHGPEDVHFPLSRGALQINLWHGVGLKATMFGDETGIVAKHQKYAQRPFARLPYLQYLTPPDAVATTSDFMQAHFSQQFRLPPERCPQLGYPRLDGARDERLHQLARSLDAEAGFELKPAGYAEAYVYMPTFRDTGRPFLDDALPDLERLSRVLGARNALLYIKLHRRTLAGFASRFDNIRVWPEEADIYAHLQDFDGLITDYSSVLYDYLAVKDGGAILYVFDYEQYVSQDRLMLYPFDENVAGVRVETFDGLCATLASGTALVSSEKVLAIREKFWGHRIGSASRAIVDHVQSRLAGAAHADA